MSIAIRQHSREVQQRQPRVPLPTPEYIRDGAVVKKADDGTVVVGGQRDNRGKGVNAAKRWVRENAAKPFQVRRA